MSYVGSGGTANAALGRDSVVFGSELRAKVPLLGMDRSHHSAKAPPRTERAPRNHRDRSANATNSARSPKPPRGKALLCRARAPKRPTSSFDRPRGWERVPTGSPGGNEPASLDEAFSAQGNPRFVRTNNNVARRWAYDGGGPAAEECVSRGARATRVVFHSCGRFQVAGVGFSWFLCGRG